MNPGSIYSKEMELCMLLYVFKVFYYLIYMYIIAILDLFFIIWDETTGNETSSGRTLFETKPLGWNL